MPVGCVHQYIVIKRCAVKRALETAVENGELDKEAFARRLLSSTHSDKYLIAIEDMGGTDYDVENLKYLGLESHDGTGWLDFYAPHVVQLPVHWLTYAPIRELRQDGTVGHVIWQGFRHVEDESSQVEVWGDEESLAGQQRQPFPESGTPP